MSRMATLIVLTLLPYTVEAYILLQPMGVSTDMRTFSAPFHTKNTINQSGLSVGYVSGVDDLDAYLSSGPTHDSTDQSNSWLSVLNAQTGNFDLDLGGTYMIDAFILWSNTKANITIFVDDNPAFTSPDIAAILPAPILDNTGTTNDPAQLFQFDPIEVSYVRLSIGGYGQYSGIGELAFGSASVSAIPEPSSYVAFAGLAICFGLAGWCGRRRSARRSAT